MKLIRGKYSRGVGVEAIGICLRVVASDVSTSIVLESNGLMPGVVAAKRATITPDAGDTVEILILNVHVKQRASDFMGLRFGSRVEFAAVGVADEITGILKQ